MVAQGGVLVSGEINMVYVMRGRLFFFFFF